MHTKVITQTRPYVLWPLNVRVALAFAVWIRAKVTAQCLNEDNICTKLDGNLSMHT